MSKKFNTTTLILSLIILGMGTILGLEILDRNSLNDYKFFVWIIFFVLLVIITLPFIRKKGTKQH